MSIRPSDTEIHGYRSRDLSVQKQIADDTLFASQQGTATYRRDYSSLSADVMLSALKLMGVGTMAFAESWEYSRRTHDHSNYTNVNASTVYGPTSDGSTQLIGRLSVSNLGVEGFKAGEYRTVDIYCLSVQPRVPDEPAYGTLRFMYKTPSVDITQNYISSDNFDGWVYPNGHSYAIKQEQFDRRNKFVTRDSNPFIEGSTLRVPDLSNYFLKLNPFSESSPVGAPKRCDFQPKPGHTAVPRHEHLISQLKASASLSFSLDDSKFTWANLAGSYDPYLVHGGASDFLAESPFTYVISVNMDSFNVKLKTTSSGDPDAECYPSHYSMPVMIYVGGRKKGYDITYAG